MLIQGSVAFRSQPIDNQPDPGECFSEFDRVPVRP
jgi:hypothetical protein